MSLILNLSPVSASPATEPYKIGALFSTTGSQSSLGVPEENTVLMLVEKINADGGINGHPLEVIIYNDESDATKANTLATKLIEQDQVLAIIGPTGTGNSMAIIDTVTTAEIPLVSCGAGASIVTPVADRYWIFKTPQTDKQVVTELCVYLQDIGITKAAIITSTSAFGQSGKTYLESEASKYGITLVDNQTFGSDDTSMISQLTHIKDTDAQAVVCWDTDKASAVVAKDMQTLQMTIPLYCSHGIANQAFIDAAGDAANGVIFPAGKLLVVDDIPATDPQKEVLTDYRDEYEALYGEDTVSTFGGYTYDALYMVIGALENMDEGLSLAESRAAIRDRLEQITNFTGISGIFTMSPTDHLGMQPGSLALIEIVDRGWTVAYTSTVPTATAVPTPTPTPTPTPGIEVHIEAIDPVASEVGPESGRFHVYTVLSPGFNADGWQKVCFTIGGTAENGVDYEQIQNCVYALVGYQVVSPPTDAPAEYIDINPIPDCIVEGNETVRLVLGNGQSAQVVILDGSCVTQTPMFSSTPTPTAITATTSTSSSTPPWLIGGIVGGIALVMILGFIGIDKKLKKKRVFNARVKQLKSQMEKWQKEGYDVSDLEDLFK